MAGQPLVGLIMGSRSDWETMRHTAETLDALAGAVREAGRLGAPHPRPALRVRRGGGEPRPAGDRGRCRRGGPSPGHDRGQDHAAGARRAGRVEGAAGDGLAALDRADARRHPGGDAGHRPGRRGERGAARRRDRGPDGCGRGRAPARLPRRRRRRRCSTLPTPPRDLVLDASQARRDARRVHRRWAAGADARAGRDSARAPLSLPRPGGRCLRR